MSDAIPPALSAEEWKDVCVEGECRNDELAHLTRGWDAADPEKRTVDDLPHHRIAAVALQDQPFGFAREDVEFLARVIDGDYDGMDLDYWVGKAASVKLDSIRARIAALLPPEGT